MDEEREERETEKDGGADERRAARLGALWGQSRAQFHVLEGMGLRIEAREAVFARLATAEGHAREDVEAFLVSQRPALLRVLWDESRPRTLSGPGDARNIHDSREDVFRRRARREGYTAEEVEFFLRAVEGER